MKLIFLQNLAPMNIYDYILESIKQMPLETNALRGTCRASTIGTADKDGCRAQKLTIRLNKNFKHFLNFS